MKFATHSQPRPPKSPNSEPLRISANGRPVRKPSLTRSSGVARVSASTPSVGGQPARENVADVLADAQAPVVDVAHARRQPLRHLDGKREEQEHVADHRRVEQVLAEAAVELLRQRDRDRAAEQRNPERHERRQRERQQRGRHERAAVAQRMARVAAAQAQHRGLGQQRSRGRQREVDEQAGAEEPRVAERRGHERVEHAAHDDGHADERACVRRRGLLETHRYSCPGVVTRMRSCAATARFAMRKRSVSMMCDGQMTSQQPHSMQSCRPRVASASKSLVVAATSRSCGNSRDGHTIAQSPQRMHGHS